MSGYDFSKIEQKWRQLWEGEETFKVPAFDDPAFDASKPKYYILDMFPYPSGKGLHVGHPLGYIATDIVARFKRMQGFNVLHPMGFDAFGLPAEQFAIETGTHPEVTTQENIENMRKQLKQCGLSYDWSREIQTIDPKYYKWTQWIFLKLYDAWFDERVDAARPIATLEKAYEEGVFKVGKNFQRIPQGHSNFASARDYKDLTPHEQDITLGKDRLAFIDDVTVNWCPGLGTVLANEEVTLDNRSERGNYPVYKRPLKQWMLRITKYADRLQDELEHVDWPEAVKRMQRNWIGKREGAQVTFDLEGSDKQINVFTTRPDTLFGCTFLVLAPEHPWVDTLVTSEQKKAIESHREKVATKSDIERQQDKTNKDGVFTGSFAIHPLSGVKIPIWIADYVLMGYGTGAVMAVPAHDQRDFEFAKKHLIKIRTVIEPEQGFLNQYSRSLMEYLEDPGSLDEAYTGLGALAQSSCEGLSINGLSVARATEKIMDFLESNDKGSRHIQFKLRDWLFSRQRYWGEPFPILHADDGTMVPVDASDLPVVLPEMKDFKPSQPDDADGDPQPSLSRADQGWKNVERNGQVFHRELNTMPQWAGSCWYYLRFIDPGNQDVFVDKAAQAYWMGDKGVDLYVGGVEHAVLHLLYARFWHKVLFDLAYVTTKEPFGKLFNQGYIQAYSYRDERGMYVPAFEIEEPENGTFTYLNKPVTRQLGKMGKSLKNAISPDEVIQTFGCDTFRLFEMYLGPVDQSKIWDTDAIVGVHRFLQRVWRNFVSQDSGDLLVKDVPIQESTNVILHRTIDAVTKDMGDMKFNTTIAHLIQLNNLMVSMDEIPVALAKAFVLMLSPLAPHMCEELWQKMGHDQSIAFESFPVADPSCFKSETFELVVQVNGKRRANINFETNLDEASIQEQCKANENVSKHLQGMDIVKCIYVPNKLINFVVRKG